MRRYHRMPLGAEALENGETRFTLWGPAAETADLILEDSALTMHREEETFTLTTEARAGTRYRNRIDGVQEVPDPASRYQPEDIHGPSHIVDSGSFVWEDGHWKGRSWEEVVLYELHVGSFTPEGTFDEGRERLDHLVELGVTAMELMPLSEFPGRRNWGYDGALPFAPESTYGSPDDLKDLVQGAHKKGLMVFLDVVYNHFWLEEYNFDGLRLDAVHTINDASGRHFLTELAGRVREAQGSERHVHLVRENETKDVHYLRGPYDAQWNDDFHHALHITPTGEDAGYYADYAEAPVRHLGRCLAEWFAYQDEPSADLPSSAFVSFIQNHDQVGNRAFGERMGRLAPPEAVRAAEIYLLAPQIPMLFMGEEWNAGSPFPYFCDFGRDLAPLLARGRREEFAEFFDREDGACIPDPGTEETFCRAVLDWGSLEEPEHAGHLKLYGGLLALRREKILPRLGGLAGGEARYLIIGERGLSVHWPLGMDLRWRSSLTWGRSRSAIPSGRRANCSTLARACTLSVGSFRDGWWRG